MILDFLDVNFTWIIIIVSIIILAIIGYIADKQGLMKNNVLKSSLEKKQKRNNNINSDTNKNVEYDNVEKSIEDNKTMDYNLEVDDKVEENQNVDYNLEVDDKVEENQNVDYNLEVDDKVEENQNVDYTEDINSNFQNTLKGSQDTSIIDDTNIDNQLDDLNTDIDYKQDIDNTKLDEELNDQIDDIEFSKEELSKSDNEKSTKSKVENDAENSEEQEKLTLFDDDVWKF